MKKKVIFVTYYFGNGGAATVMKLIAQQLVESGSYDVEIVSMLDDENKYEIPKSVKLSAISMKKSRSYVEKLKGILELRKILIKNKDAVIISFEYFMNMQTLLANIFLKNKVIISERNDPNNVGGNGKLIKKLRDFLYKKADVLVCQTLDAKMYFSKKVQEKTVVIPNPIKSDLPISKEEMKKPKIVNFCRVEKQKNLPMLIDAFEIFQKKHTEYKLFIYGDGKEKENLIRYVDSKNLTKNIIFEGFTQNIHDKIIDSKIFASSSDYEGISNSMIEAMGMGIASVVTDCPCGGARMMIENNVNGILVPVGDANAMSRAFEKLIENDEYRRQIEKNSLKIRKKLDKNVICNKWIELINN